MKISHPLQIIGQTISVIITAFTMITQAHATLESVKLDLNLNKKEILKKIDLLREYDETIFHGDTFKYLKNGGLHSGNPCSKFIDQEGNLGPWGKIIQSYINKKSNIFYRKDFTGMASNPGVCPKWNKLSEEEKTKFWVWSMAAIASIESSCKNNIRVKGVKHDGIQEYAVGLFQMEERLASRQWRGPNCKGSVKSESGNINCAMDIMTEYLKGSAGDYEDSNGKLYNSGKSAGMYWLEIKFRPMGGKIGKLIRQYSPCRN